MDRYACLNYCGNLWNFTLVEKIVHAHCQRPSSFVSSSQDRFHFKKIFILPQDQVSSWTAEKLCDSFLFSESWLSCHVNFSIKWRTYIQWAHQTYAVINYTQRNAVLILCLWGYDNALTLVCHWLKLVIRIIVLIFNKSEQSTPFAALCAAQSLGTHCEVLVNNQAGPTWIRISSSQNKLLANFAKPENAFLIFFWAGNPTTAGEVAALHYSKGTRAQKNQWRWRMDVEEENGSV